MIIENNFLRIYTKELGAELTSIFNKQTQLEHLWQAGAAWAKHAPVLFPIVGQLKNNTYFYNDKAYHLDRHGFARTAIFKVHQQSAQQIIHRLTSNQQTLQQYPFQFVFDIIYELNENSLVVEYKVENTDNKDLFFAVGAHPAFKIPLRDEDVYDDYYLEFNKSETAGRWLLADGLIATETDFFNKQNTLPLNKNLFHHDALVFKSLQSDCISIKSNKHQHGLHFQFKDFQ